MSNTLKFALIALILVLGHQFEYQNTTHENTTTSSIVLHPDYGIGKYTDNTTYINGAEDEDSYWYIEMSKNIVHVTTCSLAYEFYGVDTGPPCYTQLAQY